MLLLKLSTFISVIYDMQRILKKETSFTSKCSPNEIVSKIEETAKPLGFNVCKQNYKVKNKVFMYLNLSCS